jgi:hypothetical protein
MTDEHTNWFDHSVAVMVGPMLEKDVNIEEVELSWKKDWKLGG